uniref:Phlebovirus glycoprotein G2 fusion domain-containing protein n=1 Tax=Strongyloides stercoralis TaxID=6248 RepID=A0A0K0E2J4_STRER
MIDENPKYYYWYFPYEDITNFTTGTIHEQLTVNIWRIIIFIFLVLSITLIILTIYLCQSIKEETIKINKKKKLDRCSLNLIQSPTQDLYKYPMKSYNINNHLYKKQREKLICCQDDERLSEFNKFSICLSCNGSGGKKLSNSCIYCYDSNRYELNCNCKCNCFTKQHITIEKEKHSLPLTLSCEHIKEPEINNNHNKKDNNKDIEQSNKISKDIEQLNKISKDIGNKDINLESNVKTDQKNVEEQPCTFKC